MARRDGDWKEPKTVHICSAKRKKKKKEGKKRTTIEEYRGVDPKIQDASRDENCGEWGDTDSKKSSSVEEASVYGDNLAP